MSMPCFPPLKFAIMPSRALGIADRILALGDWFFLSHGLATIIESYKRAIKEL